MKSHAATALQRGLATGLVGLAAIALAACTTGAQPAPSPSTGGSAAPADDMCESTDIRVIRGTVYWEPVIIAQEQGIFEEHGLNVELIPGGNSAEIVAQLVSGQADIGPVGGVPVIQAAAQGLGLQAFLGSATAPLDIVNSGIVAKPDSGIEGYADLEGKIIGLQGTHDTTHLGTLLGLESVGLTEDDVTIVQLPLANLTDAVLTGQVDAAYLIGATWQPAMAAGLVVVGAPSSDVLAYSPSVTYAAKKDWMEANEATVRCFQDAIIEANDLGKANDYELIRQARIDHTDVDPEVIKKSVLAGYETDIWLSGFEILVDGMNEFGFIEEPVSVEDALSPLTPTRD